MWIKSSDEMGTGTLRQPNLRKVDLPWWDRSVSPIINIHSSIKAVYESIIDTMDIPNSNIYVYNSVMDIHNSVIYFHSSFTDIQTCIKEKWLWISMTKLRMSIIRLWISITVVNYITIIELWMSVIALRICILELCISLITCISIITHNYIYTWLSIIKLRKFLYGYTQLNYG